MESLIVEGKNTLRGRVRISGSKNISLPLIAASLLTDDPVIIEDVPCLRDVHIMLEIVSEIGAEIRFQKRNLYLDTSTANSFTAPHSLASQMRASFLVLGPLLARFGRAKIYPPGGCSIGSRPVDFHQKGLSALGVKFTPENGCIEAHCNRLTGSHIYLDFPSVGATENIMMAATMAEGETIIENAAREPEIIELSGLLTAMGAIISGAGTHTIRIKGVYSLKGTRYRVIPDRIEAGTYMIAAAIAGNRVTIENVIMDHLKPLTDKLKEAGVQVKEFEPGEVTLIPPSSIKAVNIKTMPYPGFPTDLQPPFSSLMTQAHGMGTIRETVFENRFRHVEGLTKMGADTQLNGQSLIIRGSRKLWGKRVRATDLRGAASLVLAALVAEGRTEIQEVHHLDRGYEDLALKMYNLGANVHRESSRQQFTFASLQNRSNLRG